MAMPSEAGTPNNGSIMSHFSEWVPKRLTGASKSIFMLFPVLGSLFRIGQFFR